jgi:hypothetical protein
MFDSLSSALLTLFLAFCVLWLIVQALRKLLPFRRRPEGSQDSITSSRTIHPESGAFTKTGPVSTIPDAADVLALKAAIDNLARQVASLEQRLASESTDSQPLKAFPIKLDGEPVPELPPVTPDHRI